MEKAEKKEIAGAKRRRTEIVRRLSGNTGGTLCPEGVEHFDNKKNDLLYFNCSCTPSYVL